MTLAITIAVVLAAFTLCVYVNGPGAIWSEKIKAANRRMP